MEACDGHTSPCLGSELDEQPVDLAAAAGPA